MKETSFELDMNNEESISIKKIINKYLKHWPWFLASFFICLISAFLYVRYANTIYGSTAKIKIVDDTKELNVTVDALSMIGSNSKINMDNEMQVLKSYRIISQVVDELNLDVDYYKKGRIKKTQIWQPYFSIYKDVSEENIKSGLSYEISFTTEEILFTDDQNNVENVSLTQLDSSLVNLPFKVHLNPGSNFHDLENTVFEVELKPRKETILKLIQNLKVEATSKDSDIITLSLKGQSSERSEAILNTIIKKFNQDGILDRQQVSRRTIDFIDERFLYLSTELDSIEVGKQDFKQENNLSYIEADAGISLERKSATENEVANLETQISLSTLLKKSVINQAAFELLPVNVGLENSGLNNLVISYNDLVLQRNKLSENVGDQHPSLMAISGQLENAKVNIIKTLNIYQTQLRTSLAQLNQEQSRVNNVFARLPEKEKKLRSIERQQSIKENLFLLLLQKREEAAINLAVTAPSVKVVDYGLTNNVPVSPNKMIVLGMAGLMGLLVPFGFFYLRYSIESKILERNEVLNILPNIPFLAEIPHFKKNKLFNGINDRSALAESFRILSTNIKYMLPKNNGINGDVIYVTSAIAGEGKSLMAYNLSLAYASVNKRTLLIGTDLRNPALHNYFNNIPSSLGLTDYLLNENLNWKELIQQGLKSNLNHFVCLSGKVPPNAPQLLSNGSFAGFLDEVKKEFDVIIVDTAPIMPVTDTLLIADSADVTLFVTRAGFTDKSILDEVSELKNRDKLKNIGIVLNDVKFDYKNNYGYSYTESK